MLYNWWKNNFCFGIFHNMYFKCRFVNLYIGLPIVAYMMFPCSCLFRFFTSSACGQRRRPTFELQTGIHAAPGSAWFAFQQSRRRLPVECIANASPSRFVPHMVSHSDELAKPAWGHNKTRSFTKPWWILVNLAI